MENHLVRYSRAGDVFHYRWAARRCLRLISPKSPLRQIVIEGSKERKKTGEYVIDVTEYSDSPEGYSQEVAYFQLKHTTIRKDQPFTLSDLKDTIVGFAERYSQHLSGETADQEFAKVSFSIVTNRPISENLKRKIATISEGGQADQRFQSTLKKYTKLEGRELRDFCGSLEFADGEEDYDAQRYALHVEISQLLAGTVDTPQVATITELVQEKALPNSDGLIVREDVLKRFGVTSARDLFPAPPEFEELETIVPRKQYETLLNQILEASTPVIVHAAGGVGKSVFARQVAQSLPVGSLGIIYDCFGGGRYRNRSEPRHRHRDALVQIANELASHGLCEPLIAQSYALENEILRNFLTRLRMSVSSLRKTDENATLVILIDAADNAEMAAEEFGQSCFANELLREQISEGCKLVMLCRTERIGLLRPPSTCLQLELKPFSREETLLHLRKHFSQATAVEGEEFHRLTNSGNPRVQANALRGGFDSIKGVLISLGPLGTTVEKQIEAQLESAIAEIKDKFPLDYRGRIDAICLGLATLPPFIPLSVLATTADVDESTVKSFVADLGRPLWLSDTSVQFRDEPTETWFRKRFSATPDQIASYVKRLQPLAYDYPYVAEALPSLLLQAEKYDELIDLALSDDYLPKDNPIDERNVRVYRLQFAFKAALKLKRYADATKLALRAGEEVAGDKRQLELLAKNVDLIAPLQSEQRVQELAFRRVLRGEWDGSENVYSAALLSSVDDFKGEAVGYLRAANNWLQLYFEERRKSKEKYNPDLLKDDDILELAFSYLNLFGATKAVDFILSWQPREVIYRIARRFIKRLVDAGNFEVIDEISMIDSRSQYLMIALAHELLLVGRFPKADSMERCLDLLTASRARIPKPGYSYEDTTASAIVSFLEACAARGLAKKKILRALRHYFPIRATRTVVSRDFPFIDERDTYLRATALRCVLVDSFEPNLEQLLPEKSQNERSYEHEQNAREFKGIVDRLLPWYILRARVLVDEVDGSFEIIKSIDQRSRSAQELGWRSSNALSYEISGVRLRILALYYNVDEPDTKSYFVDWLKENQHIRIQDRLNAVRAAFRLDHLSGLRGQLERSTYEVVTSASGEGPEAIAELYVDLARAVLPLSRNDAAVYFDFAIEAVSKFGDEIARRWEAVAALADRSAVCGHSSPQLEYRFIRCAELIGENVAREKYWDRNEAVKICSRLSPVSALAALSRWRDRGIGWFDAQLRALADDLVRSNSVAPSVGWSLSAFFEEYGISDFAALCIEHESSTVRQQYILDTAIRALRLNEAPEKSWRKIEQVAQKYSLENAELRDVLAFYNKNPEKSKDVADQQTYSSPLSEESEHIDWANILDDLDLTTSLGISEAIQRFDAIPITPRNVTSFWQEAFEYIDESDANKFLQALVVAENADVYDVRRALSCLPDVWRQKVSVRRNWAKIIRMFAQRFTAEITNHYTLEYSLKPFFEEIGIDDAMPFIYEGILKGLSSTSDLVDASTFFAFVEISSHLISPQQAGDLLDFALDRFELHIDDEFADGKWSNWLEPPEDISVAFAGFVWAALGSPRSETRWQAAHCVRRLAESNCTDEIEALFEWMASDEVGPFGSHRFPFYNLHARLYLLIALARVSIDAPHLFRHHHQVFLHHALEASPHILIQKFSAETALNIEATFPNTYDRGIVEKLQQVGISQLPHRELNGFDDKVESYWHMNGEVDTTLEFFHGYDFVRYWLEALGGVFGISSQQVEDLATEVVIREWDVDVDGSYRSDPRAGLWRSYRNEKEIRHSHGSYPRTDNYSFYLSYHAIFVTASKLLRKMPVVQRRNWHEDEWAEWLHRHSLTRDDGRWLADRRDPAPLLQRDWIHQKDTKDWRSEITAIDFLDGILFGRKGETWLNVFGSWAESDGHRKESFRVSTALVSPTPAQSLLYALTSCSDPYEYKLPDYQERDMEYESDPFVLKGWVWRSYTDSRLDQYDPHAAEIAFPPYQIGQSVVDIMGLSSDAEQREWFLPDREGVSLLSELWSTNRPGLDEDPRRRGERLSASLGFLKRLCLVMECELVFEVQIDRKFTHKSYARNTDELEFTPPHSKIYLLSADGKLRDTETCYQLREGVSWGTGL